MIIAVLITFCLTATLFTVIPTKSGNNSSYDPWKDLNDDEVIDSTDLGLLGTSWASTGNPINKTAVLLEILERIDHLNISLQDLEAYVETIMPKKGKIIIPPVQFQPRDNTQSYYRYGTYLKGNGWFETPLQLPEKAIIINKRHSKGDRQ